MRVTPRTAESCAASKVICDFLLVFVQTLNYESSMGESVSAVELVHQRTSADRLLPYRVTLYNIDARCCVQVEPAICVPYQTGDKMTHPSWDIFRGRDPPNHALRGGTHNENCGFDSTRSCHIDALHGVSNVYPVVGKTSFEIRPSRCFITRVTRYVLVQCPFFPGLFLTLRFVSPARS